MSKRLIATLPLYLVLVLIACGTTTHSSVNIYVSLFDGDGGIGSHTIAAFDAQTGKERWHHASQTALGPVFLAQDSPSALYVGGIDQRLYALNASDGSPLWSYQTASLPYVVAASDGMIYVGTSGVSLDQSTIPPDAVYALNARDGSLKWRSQETGFLVAASDDMLYLRTATQQVDALRTSDGSLRWQFQAEADVFNVHMQEGLVSVFAQGYDRQPTGALYVLNAESGSLRWRYPSLQTKPFLSLLAFGSNSIYLAEPSFPERQAPGIVLNFTAGDGSVRWRRQVDAPSRGTEANGVFYLGATNGLAYALDSTTGSLRWQVSSEDHAPRAVQAVQVNADLVYVIRDRAGVSVLAASDGSLRWHYETDRHEDGFVWVSGIREGMVCFGSVFQAQSSIEVVRATDGVSLWQHPFSGVYLEAVVG